MAIKVKISIGRNVVVERTWAWYVRSATPRTETREEKLQEGNRFVDEGGNHPPEGLGQDHLAHGLEVRHPESAGSLDLPAIDALNAAAKDFGEVG